ncbi:putative deacetylase LmbE-like domain-containing protein [Gilbertella persicaria]|uniref:putative deacetylase LmbE-like domain-containing protein n=1 Tax=Gilbertella persicaria TaxID=101096 RepID=UPI0022211CF0|nr:putative deacetylase LmbE-like domain-containing protein [Gilbertella persicaria]KAI8087898.1 putative deacetylase LmbE-like domain-containing protein [Gilbertella persicaria]
MFVILSLIFVTSLLVYAYFSLAHFQKVLPFKNNILVLTAHPDDECMFFGPTLTSLRTLTKARVHILCLSTGNAEGLGHIRKKELSKSCQTFGILPSHIKSIDHPQLQDGMQNQWSPELISHTLKDYVTKQKIDTIITFDNHGVSGHANHIALYYGAKHFVQQHTNITLYSLESVSLIRKYIGFADLIVPKKQGSIQLVSPPIAYLLTHKAMRQHTSQLVWFRWLYVTFSRFMYVNDLVKEEL